MFQLQAKAGYFKHKPRCLKGQPGVVNGVELNVRRLQFPLVPSDRIVHSAQGAEMTALVLDMARPPKMDPQLHWLAMLVQLSRALGNGEGLLIARLPTLEELNYGPPESMRLEMARLHKVQEASLSALRDRIGKLGVSRAVWKVMVQICLVSSSGFLLAG